jgi:hypothetical protein
VADQVLREFGQLGAIELAVAVGIKRHRMRDDAFDRRRAAWSSAAAASSGSRAASAGTAGTAFPRSGSSGPGTATVVSRPVLAGSAGATFGLRAPTKLLSASVPRSGWSTLRMEFVFGQLAVAVLVEFLQRGRRVGDLFRRKLAVVIGVERLHQRIARRTLSASAPFKAALGRASLFVLVVAPRRALRRLGNNRGRAQSTEHAGDPKRATHELSPSKSRRRKVGRGDRHFPLATQ